MIQKSLFLFILFSVIASAMNYLIYPLLSHILAPAEYVNITVSLSLFTQISTFLSSIIAITIGLTKGESDSDGKHLESLQRYMFKLFAIIALIFLALSPIIMSWSHTPVPYAIPVTIMMLFSIPILFISGYLNGKNKMVSLGLVALISASSQFIFGLVTAVGSHSGLVTMFAMTISQLTAILLIYFLLSKANLPNVFISLKTGNNDKKSPFLRKLIIYTALSALAVMTIGVIQIIDLLLIQGLSDESVKFYTDIYVISRIVFFAGMIFIWPFLGEISIRDHLSNRKPFIKLFGYFVSIGLSASAALYFFGDTITFILFNEQYSLETIRTIATLSILFKLLMLTTTAVVLYFIVMRSYIAVWLSLFLSLVLFAYTQFIQTDTRISIILIGLNVITGITTLIAVYLIIRTPIAKE